MKDLIIVGAGATGRERLDAVKKINRIEKRWNIKGFLSDVPDVLDGVECDYPIIGTIVDYVPQPNDVFVNGIATPKDKEKVVTAMKAKGAVFETIIHPGSCVGDFTKIGEGCFIGGSVGPNVVLGDFVDVMASLIGGSSVIGDFSTTTGYANVASARLGKGVFVGSHAVILNGVKIGDYAVVGVASVAYKNVPANVTVIGNPAKIFEF